MTAEQQRRTERLQAYLTEDERSRVYRKADACGLSVGAYVRRALLAAHRRRRPSSVDRSIVHRLDVEALELDRLARPARSQGEAELEDAILGLVRRMRGVVAELAAAEREEP